MFLDKTLEELDGIDWGEPTYPSTLVEECHRLRRIPLRDFTDGDLRRLIGQKISLDYLVPLSLMRLTDESFAGDLYSGDMLNSLLSLPSAFWEAHPDLRGSFTRVVSRAAEQIDAQDGLREKVPVEVIALLRGHVADAV